MARFFINRPIFAIVLSLIVVLVGTIAGLNLPIEQYPNIEAPRINVQTQYLGANAGVVESTIANAIEQQVNGTEGMVDMRATSDSNGNYSLTVTFDLEKDQDMAAVDVQNRVSRAMSSLPSEVVNGGVVTTKQSSNNIMFFALYSPNRTYDSLFMKNYGSMSFIDEIKRVKGVSTVSEYGPEYSMRIWLKPDKMAQLNVTAMEISQAVKQQSVQSPTGSIGQLPMKDGQEFEYSTRINSQLNEPEDFKKIVIRALSDGSTIRLGDVADVRLEAKQNFIKADINGQEAVVFAIQLTPDANALTTVEDVRKVLENAEKNFPEDIKLKTLVDNTEFIKQSLYQVIKTFIEALVLVVLVLFIFLQNWRATVIPMLAIPVSLVGTFGAFMVLGFTINTLTMFAMVLAIGLVVDDAIIVVEAVEHHIDENKLSPKEATYRAMDEVSGPVIATTFVLASVFIPVAFFGGTVGALYKQFALTITVSMALSAFVALTLTPALCAILLEPREIRMQQKRTIFTPFFNWFNRIYGRVLESYMRGVNEGLHQLKTWFVVVLVISGTAIGLLMYLPSVFVPEEDQGFYFNLMMFPEATALNRTREVSNQFAAKLKGLDGVENVFVVSGLDMMSGSMKSSGALVGVGLKPWDQRTTIMTQASILTKISMGEGMKFPEMFAISVNPSPLPGASSTGALSFVITDQLGSSTPEEVEANINQFIGKLTGGEYPEIGGLRSAFRTGTPSFEYKLDRDKVAKLGVPVSDALMTLQVFSGGYQVNDFTKFERSWDVLMQADAEYREDISSIRLFHVRNNQGELIPLSNLVTYEKVTGPAILTRYNAMRSVSISGDPSPGFSTGDAMKTIEKVAKETLPAGYVLNWTDQSRDEAGSGSRSIVVFGLAIVFAFLGLAALYESWTVPLSILLSVSTALFGATFFQFIRGLENSVYMQIGLVMLIGLAAKNAILIVEYAKINMEEQGMNAYDATVEAARLRFRPILMTSFTFIIGCLPLAIASGAGAGSRVAMGNTVVGGMLFATLLGVFVIPTLFLTVETIVAKFSSKSDHLEE